MRTALLSCLLPTCLFAAQDLRAQDPDRDAWMSYMLPAEAHAALEVYEGDWTEEISMWMAPGAEPQKFQLDCSMRMALEGRFLELAHSGMLAGAPFGGLTLLGHNNASSLFELISISNMGTGILRLQGGWKEKGSTIELRGVMASPVGENIAVRQLITLKDKNSLLIQHFDTYPGGTEYRSIAYTFTRKH